MKKQAGVTRDYLRTDPLLFTLQIGFFAGLIWGGMRWLMYEFHFTVVVPSFIIEPFFLHRYLITLQGLVIGWAGFIVFSILTAILYTTMFRHIVGPWLGIIYGFVWWCLLFIIPGPQFGLMIPIWNTTWNTVWTELCLMIVWGLFIGYSISTEFNQEQARETNIGQE